MRKIIFTLLAAVLTMPACVGKNYKRPAVDLPSVSVAANETAKGSDKDIASFENANWWHIFQDVVLDKMIDESLKYNQDLKMAMARVDESKAKLAAARSNFYPSIDLTGSISDSKNSDVIKNYVSRFKAGVSVSYEIDLWGKYWRGSESAKATFLSSKADRDAVRLTLTANVAKMYFQLRALDSQLAIAQTTLKSREDSYNVYSSRFEKGVVNELDLRRVEAEMESVRAQVYSVEYYLKVTETSLSILLGRNPRAIVEEKPERGNKIEDIIIIPEIPANVPSDVISRRPDVMSAEYALKSLNADVGAAKAALFPKISLTGFGGAASYELEDLFKDHDIWSYSGDVVVPLFHGGKIYKDYKAAQARYDQMLASYQKTIETSFKEVLDSINTYKLGKDTSQARQKQTAALQKSYDLSIKREKAGLADLLDVLDVQRMLLQSQIDLVTAQQNQLNAVVDVCRSLGGGWTEDKGFVGQPE